MKVWCRKVLLSTGELTMEVWLHNGGAVTSESAPSGCTLGAHEAPLTTECDGEFERVVEAIPAGVSQQEFDLTIERFGTQLATPASLAFFKSNARNATPEGKMPRIICNVVNGGKHTNGSVDMCEFMIIPGGETVDDQVNAASTIYLTLGRVLERQGQNPYITGREGGYVTTGMLNHQVVAAIDAAIKETRLDCHIAIDVAANNFSRKDDEGFSYRVDGQELTSQQMLEYYDALLHEFPKIIYLEDPFHEEDRTAWREIYARHHDILIVADDITVTSSSRIREAKGLCNGVVCKVNQTGTVSGLIDAIETARSQGMTTILSQRSGETDSGIIADLSVFCAADYLKAGAPARERIIKYNRLLRIEEHRRLEEHVMDTKWRLGVLMFIRRNDSVLIIRKTGRDEWQLPAGGKEGSETVMDTLRREAREELSLDIDETTVSISFHTYEYEFPAEWKAKRGCFGQRQFIAIIDLPAGVDVQPDMHEIEEIRFVPKEKLIESLAHRELKETILAMKKEGEIDL